MTKTVISVENLTKRYDLGVIGTGTLSRDLNRWWARLRGKPDPYTRIGQRDHFEKIGESILALNDVSFKVGQGEALGIIGKNGAGKSTLLKILSRVTAPTSGIVKMKGRIGSLLEVGTGFHPELTGRENVYLNGAILGMRKEEVARKFDEIVDFSGVEKFIDTPVKRYSSGMYVRLAFAVAAHLDPEILVVDEVLAVGDAEFQKKCLGKMGDVAGEGRTVLFVSHNMAAIQNLCGTAILLENGRIEVDGITENVVERYLDKGREENVFSPNLDKRSYDRLVKINNFWVNPSPAKTGKPVEFNFEISKSGFSNNAINTDLAIGILSMKNERIFHIYSRHMGSHFNINSNKLIIKAYVESLDLVPGIYRINLWMGFGNQTFDFIQDCYKLTVDPGYFKEGYYIEARGYQAVIKSKWTCDRNEL